MSYQSVDPSTAVPVTGEAVALDLRLAKLPSRTIALALDVTIQVVALVLIFTFLSLLLTEVDSALAAAISLTLFVFVIVGYPAALETLTHGRTVGKLAVGLRVVRTDGGPVRFRHSLVRAMMLVIELWLTWGLVGLLASLFNAQGRRLGDLFGGTLVVNERVSGASTPLAYQPIPPGWEAWAAHLDLGRLPEPVAGQARQVLSRWHDLAPDVRHRLVLTLAAEVATYVSPQPPAGTDPTAYLAAVLGERSRRAFQAAYPQAPQPQQPPPPTNVAPPARHRDGEFPAPW